MAGLSEFEAAGNVSGGEHTLVVVLKNHHIGLGQQLFVTRQQLLILLLIQLGFHLRIQPEQVLAGGQDALLDGGRAVRATHEAGGAQAVGFEQG